MTTGILALILGLILIIIYIAVRYGRLYLKSTRKKWRCL